MGRANGLIAATVALLWLIVTGCHKIPKNATVASMNTRPKLTLSCSFDRAAVVADSGETIAVHVRAISPAPYKLGYFWTAPEGTFKGTGPDMEWNPHQAPPGTYAISVRVDDGHGGEATCSMQVQVEPKSPR